MSSWFEQLFLNLDSQAHTELLAALATPAMTPLSLIARVAGTAALRWLPPGWRTRLTDWAKHARRTARLSSYPGLLEPGLAAFPPEARPWRGRRGALVLTHDIDTKACAEALDGVLREERKRGLTSSVFVLASPQYAPPRARLTEIAASGVGVGLHGWDHDAALGGRKARRISYELWRALDRLAPVRPFAFRAPAFSTSPRLMCILVDLGFRYDSSRAVFHPAYHTTRCAAPFPVPETQGGLWELPVVIEDALLFRDWRLGSAAALAYCRRVIDRVVDAGGVVTVNLHPSTALRFPSFYPALLDLCGARGDLWCAQLSDVIDHAASPCADWQE